MKIRLTLPDAIQDAVRNGAMDNVQLSPDAEAKIKAAWDEVWALHPWFSMTPPPRYPDAPVLIPKGMLLALLRQLNEAARSVTDDRGLLVAAQGDWEDMQDIALEALSKWLRCEVRVSDRA